MKRVLALCLFVTVAGLPLIAQSERSGKLRVVTGDVVDSSGIEVKGAFVSALPVIQGGVAAEIQWVPTDGMGKFRMVLKPGKYIIRAKAEDQGYPDPSFLLARDPETNFPEILLQNKDLSGVRILLGARGGVVDIDVVDSTTRDPVPKAQIRLQDAHDEKVWVDVYADQAGHLSFAVPHRQLRILASAPGYADTRVAEEVLLAGGERRPLVIELRASQAGGPR